MMRHNRKLYLLISAIILAITLYQISLQQSTKQTTPTDHKDFDAYKINTKDIKENKQGTIDSH